MIRAQAEHEGHAVELELHDRPEDRLNRGRFYSAEELAVEWPVLAFVTPPGGAQRRLWVRLAVTAELWRHAHAPELQLARQAVDVAKSLPGYPAWPGGDL